MEKDEAVDGEPMSVEALAWAFEQQHILPMDKFVLIALADRTGDEYHHVSPSIDVLSKATSLDETAVRESLDRLSKAGLIEPTDFMLPGFDAKFVRLRVEEGQEG